MNPVVFLAAVTVMAVVGMIARATIKIAQLRSSNEPSEELTARIEELESTVHNLQQEVAEAQERLDFAERLLSKPQK